MIVFTPLTEFKNMLMAIRPDVYNFYEFNLSNPIPLGLSLEALIPDGRYFTWEVISGYDETAEFDKAYGNFVMSNTKQFHTLMQIMNPLYTDPCACVIIYISYSKIRDIVMESLYKLIQQRYGYIPYIINTLEDIECIKDDMSFNPRGIVTMQGDSERALLEGFYGPIVIPQEE